MSRERVDLQTAIGPDRALVYAQLALVLIVTIGAPVEFLESGGSSSLSSPLLLLAGFVLCGIGLAVASIARRNLAGSFTMSPTPTKGGQLVDTGAYGRVRHPIYLGVILMVLGWSLIWGSWFGLAGSLVVTVFFLLKSRREERLLASRYPGYAEYRQRVRGGIFPRP